MTDNPTPINELSSVIGELRNFAAAQIVTNTHIVEELKKISERMTTFGEVGATFLEYRKTLHERFGKIHEQITEIDEEAEQVSKRLAAIEILVASWKANWKLAASILYVVMTLTSAVISAYGTSIVKTIIH